mgnify:CR=1 FL=1
MAVDGWDDRGEQVELHGVGVAPGVGWPGGVWRTVSSRALHVAIRVCHLPVAASSDESFDTFELVVLGSIVQCRLALLVHMVRFGTRLQAKDTTFCVAILRGTLQRCVAVGLHLRGSRSAPGEGGGGGYTQEVDGAGLMCQRALSLGWTRPVSPFPGCSWRSHRVQVAFLFLPQPSIAHTQSQCRPLDGKST